MPTALEEATLEAEAAEAVTVRVAEPAGMADMVVVEMTFEAIEEAHGRVLGKSRRQMYRTIYPTTGQA